MEKIIMSVVNTNTLFISKRTKPVTTWLVMALLIMGSAFALVACQLVKPIADTAPEESCPVTQPPKTTFIPPAPYPEGTPAEGDFWYGTDELWTSLRADGSWWGLPYHTHEDGSGHYVQKVVWWNKDYDWQSEPKPEFNVKAQRLDGPAPTYQSSEATNLYHPDFGSGILTGVEVPTLGCWEFTAHYKGHELSFVVWVEP